MTGRIREYHGVAYIPPRHVPNAYALADYLQRVRPSAASAKWPRAVPYGRGDAIQTAPSLRYLSAAEVRALIAEYEAMSRPA